MKSPRCTRPLAVFALCILHFVLLFSSCSIPVLETRDCSEARDVVKQFYSFHVGNDMTPSTAHLSERRRFLTAELFESLSKLAVTRFDRFTASENYPKAFRVGECRIEAANSAAIQVLLFWRDDTKSEQKELTVNVVKQDSKWLINKVSN